MSAQPALARVEVNGVSLAYFEWRADLRGTAPTLLLAHATGFHGRVWDRIVARLPARHVIAIEHRGHGRSQSTPITSWEIFGRDLAAFAARLGLERAVGIGHSMGAHALVQAAAYEEQRFARLVLIDPVILAPSVYHRPPPPADAAHPASNRKNRFESADAMFARFADRPPYSVFDREVLRDYCDHALRPADDGDGLVLACDPRTEASVYLNARSNGGVYASIRALRIPVLVIRARTPAADRTSPDFTSSPTWPGLVGEFHRGSEIHVADGTHLLPMERPGEIAKLIGVD